MKLCFVIAAVSAFCVVAIVVVDVVVVVRYWYTL